MTIASCPVCSSTNLETSYPVHAGSCITSDMMVLSTSSLKNNLCGDCGLIFNLEGTRGKTATYYRDSYNLMLNNPDSAIQSFAGPQPMSQAERTYLILHELVELPPCGHVLEAGAGKGDFLDHFVSDLPDWHIHAFEPSEAVNTLRNRFPGRPIERCEFASYTQDAQSFELLVALGVLEHVENPLTMLRWGNEMLAQNGIFYLRVPNFANNPNDLFCADHLSKLTKESLFALARASGFEVAGVKEAGVPIFVALRKVGRPGEALENTAEENRKVLNRNVKIAEGTLNAILQARNMANELRERFAIFGLGPAGLFAPLFADFPVTDIAAYIDENRSLWGGEIHGRPIGGLDLIESEQIRHIALSISPVYREQVSAKLRPLGVHIYSA